jgi:hypothetical protein
MSTLDQARATQLKNIEKKTGHSLDELRAIIAENGLKKHGEIRQMLIERFGLGFGDAGQLVHYALATDGQSAAETAGLTTEDVLAEIYTGAKAPLRPLHEALMAAIQGFGPFEIVPKKGYVSLRRKRQFAMLGPASKGRLEVGLNMKGMEGTSRLEAQPPGGMCQFKVFLTSAAEVDAELIGWIRQAYEGAG